MFSLRFDEGKIWNFSFPFSSSYIQQWEGGKRVFIVSFSFNSTFAPFFHSFTIWSYLFSYSYSYFFFIERILPNHFKMILIPPPHRIYIIIFNFLLFFFVKFYSQVSYFPFLMRISSQNWCDIHVSKNRWGYFSLISYSLSHVSSSICEFLHNTLTNKAHLFLSTFLLQSMILTGVVSRDKSSFTSVGTKGSTHEGSTSAFYNKCEFYPNT